MRGNGVLPKETKDDERRLPEWVLFLLSHFVLFGHARRPLSGWPEQSTRILSTTEARSAREVFSLGKTTLVEHVLAGQSAVFLNFDLVLKRANRLQAFEIKWSLRRTSGRAFADAYCPDGRIDYISDGSFSLWRCCALGQRPLGASSVARA